MSKDADGFRRRFALWAIAMLGRLRAERKGDVWNLSAHCALAGAARKDTRP